jgi:hypothetical protein
MSAFGKDRAVLRTIPSFRQAFSQYNQPRPQRSGSGIPYFIGQYRPPEDAPDTVALIAGKYEIMKVDASGEKPVAVPIEFPYVEFTEHFDGSSNKSAICCAGPFRDFRDLRNPCNGCDIFFATLEPRPDGKGKKSTRMSKQSKYAVNVIDFSAYHKQAQFDIQTGVVKTNPKTKEPYFNWIKCAGRGCEMCAAKLPTKFGHATHWPMSWGFMVTLQRQDREIGKSCRSCGGIDTIVAAAWTCKGCGKAAMVNDMAKQLQGASEPNSDMVRAVIDLATTNLTNAEIEKKMESHYTCECGTVDFLTDVIECTKCSNADRMTLFDIEWKLLRIATGPNQSTLSMSNWTLRRQLPADSELLKPRDLIRIFAPTPNKNQLQIFGPPPLNAPGGTQDQGQAEAPSADESRAYGQQYR